nr:DUF4164 family protein [Pseudovibrio hongkongensis]
MQELTENRQGVNKALERLTSSIDAVQRCARDRLSKDKSLEGLEEDILRLGEDRSELAAKLDRAEARCDSLVEVNRDVSRRLVNAMETIRSVLDGQGQG